MEGWWTINPNQQTTLSNGKNAALSLRSPTVYYYARISGKDYAWKGDYSFSFKGQSLSMRQETLALDSLGNYVLEINCSNLSN